MADELSAEQKLIAIQAELPDKIIYDIAYLCSCGPGPRAMLKQNNGEEQLWCRNINDLYEEVVARKRIRQ